MKYISIILLALILWNCEPYEAGKVEDYKKYDSEIVEELANDIQLVVKEIIPQVYEVEYLRGEGGEDVNAIPFVTWDFGNGETSEKDKDTIFYTYPGEFAISFNGYTYDGDLSKEIETISASDTLWCNIGRTITMDNFDDNAAIAGQWVNKNKNDTPLFDEYHVDSNPYQFPEDNNVLLIGKAGGWWTEVAYEFDNEVLDFSAAGLYRKIGLKFHVPSKFEVPEGNFDFDIPESYLNIKIGLNDGSNRQEIDREIKLSELDQWIETEFDFTDAAFDQIDPTNVESIWVMFTHNWDDDRGAGRDGTGVIMVDDITLTQRVPGCL